MHLSIETIEGVPGSDKYDSVIIRWSVYKDEADVREAAIYQLRAGKMEPIDVDTLPAVTGKTWEELETKAVEKGRETLAKEAARW